MSSESNVEALDSVARCAQAGLKCGRGCGSTLVDGHVRELDLRLWESVNCGSFAGIH